MVKAIVLSGWVLSLVVILSILVTTMYFLISGQAVPDILREWAGICLGFLFGTFMGMVKDYIESKSDR